MWQRHPIQNEHVMFITTNVQHKAPLFSDSPAAKIAVETLYSIQDHYPFFLYGFVIMPDHCHLLLQVPEHGSVSKMIGVYKRAVTFNLGQGPVWQSRFHLIIPSKAHSCLDYIHMNPVKAGLCEKPEDYPWSSASGRWDVMELDLN
jgi:putative transposase